MKTALQALLIGFMTVTTSLYGEIFEISAFRDVSKYAKKRTIFLVDLDDTLFIPDQTLGSFAWFKYRYEQNIDSGLDSAKALQKTQQEWEAVQALTGVHIVADDITPFLDEIASGGFRTIGITSRRYTSAPVTQNQLSLLNLKFYPAADKGSFFRAGSQAVLFLKGVLYADWENKLEATAKLLKTMRLHPRYITYISGNLDDLYLLEQLANSDRVEFTGLYYNPPTNNSCTEFRSDVADVEWIFSSFECIISDATAKEYLEYLSPK